MGPVCGNTVVINRKSKMARFCHSLGRIVLKLIRDLANYGAIRKVLLTEMILDIADDYNGFCTDRIPSTFYCRL